MRLGDIAVTFVGHPFAPIGMGEQLRSHVAAAASVHLHHQVLDIFRHSARSDPAHEAIMGARERLDGRPGGIRVFHVNGDEVPRVIEAFEARGGRFADGFNVIVPAWELPVYPRPWAAELARFDEVWAISRFVQAGFAAAGIASHVVGQSIEMPPGPALPRRWFGIRESAFVLLHFFDLSSYAARKNPQAVLELLARLRAAHPYRDIQLVLKVKDGAGGGEGWGSERPHDPQIKILHAPLESHAVRSLIMACDCFVSLHRAEGFGRGLGEAMALQRLALGTGWSGNLDFMTPHNALLVDQSPARVAPGAYPHGEGQSWAEPDVAHAAALLAPILDDPARGQALARRGQIEVLRGFGNRAVGLRILDRLQAIAERLPIRRDAATDGPAATVVPVASVAPAVPGRAGAADATAGAMMLNLWLAAISAVLWGSAYGWYFSRDIRLWWRRRAERRSRYARFGIQRAPEHAARPPAPRPPRDVSAARRPADPLFPPPTQPAAQPATPARRGGSNVVPFPARPATGPRRPQ